MRNCNNPECNKEIPNNLNYCSQECLKRHLEIKQERKSQNIQVIKYTSESNRVVKELCDVFGFTNTEGKIVGEHNSKILSFLFLEHEGVYKTMVDKLTWICHTSARNLKENYLYGIEAFGIIETFTNDFGVLKWRWIGIKALRDNGSE